MKFIKNHKTEFILLVIVGLILLVSVIMFLVVWFQGTNNKYGDRLNGIEKVELKEDYMKSLLSKIKEEKEYVIEDSYNLEGRLLSVSVKVKSYTDKNETKKIGDIIKENLKEEELSFYDIQLYINFEEEEKKEETEENKVYPIIGYKHKTSDSFVWSNN